ncbi:DUF2059 domain-containing protein [Methylocella sp.]|uniref:DUF2059 domain-containing protein n=1 Tax=Methylocella sp. TaxID=1978226 RepID=UPI003783E88D
MTFTEAARGATRAGAGLARAALFAALAATLAHTAAHAQKPALAPAAPAPAPAAPAAPVIKPSHLAAARALVLASGMSRSFTVVVPQFMEQIGESLAQTRPELAQDLRTVLGNLQPEFERLPDEMIGLSAQIFAQRMSEADINAAVAFFTSAAGKDYVAAQPAVLSDIVVAMQGWQGKISTQMMSRVREEMKKKGHDV